MSIPPNDDDENPYVFDAKQPLPRRQGQNQKDWEGSVVEDIKDEVGSAVLDGLPAAACYLAGDAAGASRFAHYRRHF
jgi:hypothetical protein